MITVESAVTSRRTSTAIGLLCIFGLFATITTDSSLEPESFQHANATAVAAASPHSSACDPWLPDLLNVKSWRGWGAKCPGDITVVTQLSMDRLDMLERLCITWHGWVSAAVYLPLPTAPLLNQTVVKLDAFHASTQLAGSCKMDIMLYVSQGAPHPSQPPMHPINALRNRAIAAAQTEVLLLLDVDFMVSHSLNELHHSSWVQTAVAQGALVVIPALEPVMSDAAAQQEVVRVCQGGKAEAVAGLEQGVLQAFKVDVSKETHFATDFEKWVKTDQPYNIQHHWRFEPYVLVSKTKVPWYDERFTGYLQNKILHVRSMMHLDFTFVAHPDAFLVHYPHPPSKHKTLVLDHAGLKQEIKQMGKEATDEMAAGTYWAPTRFAPCHDSVPYITAATTGFQQGCMHDGSNHEP